MSQRIEYYNDGELVYVAFDPNAIIDHSDYVHPLVIVDYAADETIVGFSVSGPMIEPALSIHLDHRHDRPALVAALRRIEELQPA